VVRRLLASGSARKQRIQPDSTAI